VSDRDDIWKQPAVKAALKEGRQPDDIAVLNCPKCGRLGYYNQGSIFFCRYCNKGWYCCSEGETPPSDRPYMFLDDVVSLADTVVVDDAP
jgi:hypothetical protein